jgi:hypothetical protein
MPSTTTRTPVQIAFERIEDRFDLAGYYWLDGSYKAPVAEKDGGYLIRVQMGETTRGRDTTTKYDYFELDADGIIVSSPRGHAKEFNRKQVVGLGEAVVKYAAPDANAPRLAF